MSHVKTARSLIVEQLGAERCAAWAGVNKNTVYQWLTRGTADEPIPVRKAFLILAGAHAAGEAIDVRALIPSLPACLDMAA